MSKTISYNDYLIASLKNPKEAAEYLDVALQDGDLAVFMLALKDVVKALGGGVGGIAARSLSDLAKNRVMSLNFPVLPYR